MRVIAPDLLPGTAYTVQVRADNGEQQSEWSPAFTFTTDIDTTPPKVPTGGSWFVSGDSFHGEWNAVTQNQNNITVPITRYEIELVAGAETRIVAVPQTTDATVKFDLSYEQNRALFGTPQPVVALRVRAVDNKDLKSAWTTSASASNPSPTAPTSPVASGSIGVISVSWTPPAGQYDTDIAEYRVYIGSTSTSTPSSTNRIFRGNATSMVYNTSIYTEQFLKISAVDKFNQESPFASASATATSPFAIDTTPPSTPTNLAATITNNPNGIGAKASLTWTNGSETDRAGIEVSYKRNSDSVWTSAMFGKDHTSGIIELTSAYTAYDFRVRAFDHSANYSTWSATLAKPAVANTAPANVASMSATAGRDSITYAWAPVADLDIKNYEVTFSTSSTFASGNVTYLTGTSTSLTVSGLTPSTTYYARVRAVDQGGLTSALWSSTNTTATTAFPLSDGTAPPSSPAATVSSGIGYLYVNWTAVANSDPVTYEVHISTTSGFTPASGTKVAEVSGTSIVLEKDAAGTALAYGTTYYVRLIAKDRDGSAAAGTQGSGSPSKAALTDIVQLDVTNITNAASTSYADQAEADAKTYADNVSAAAQAAAEDYADTVVTTAANGKNKITYSPFAPVNGTDTGILGDTWYVRTTVNSKVQITAVYELTTAPSTWTQRKISGATLDELDAGTITVGTLSANRIGANTITASKMVISDFTNLVEDSEFLRPIGETWVAVTGSIARWSIAADATEGNILTFTADTSNVEQRLRSILSVPARPGESFTYKVKYRSSISGATPTLRLVYRNKAGTFVSQSTSISLPASASWSTVSFVESVPDNSSIYTAQYEFVIPAAATSGTMDIVAPKWHRAANGSLIVDGAITATKLNVGLGGDNLFINSSFESATPIGAGGNGATVAASTTVAYRGTKSVQVTTGASASPYHTASNMFAETLKTNTKYTFTTWVYNPSTGGVPSLLASVQGTGVTATVNSTASTVTDRWVPLRVTFTTAATVGTISGLTLASGTPGTGKIFYVGAIKLEEGDLGSNYTPRADEILPGTITANHIDAGAVTAVKLGVDVIESGYIKSSLINTNQLLVTGGTLGDTLEGTRQRGNNLITNGTGVLRNNYNFSMLDADLVDAPPGSSSAFIQRITAPATTPPTGQIVTSDEFIPYTPDKAYKFSFDARDKVSGGTGKMYGMMVPCDAYGLSIIPSMAYYIIGTTTTLAAPLNPGDTTITLTSSANWYGSAAKPAGSSTHLRAIIFWDYVDQSGKVWPEHTYSRNITSYDMWADAGISGNVITLRNPWSGPAKPAGTKLSNMTSGGNYVYTPNLSGHLVPNAWTHYESTFNAIPLVTPEGQAATGGRGHVWNVGLPYATSKIKIGWLMNYQPTGTQSHHAVANVSLRDDAAITSTFYTTGASPTVPVSSAIGDLWIHTNAGITKIYRASSVGAAAITSNEWVIVSDDSATPTTFVQSAIPTSISIGDVWIDTDDGKMYRATVANSSAAGSWALVNDPAVSGNRTFAQGTVPTSTMAGDMWVNTSDNNKIYVANVAGVSAIVASGNGWYLRNDLTSKTKTFVQGTVPTSVVAGDTWINTSDAYKVYVANAAGVSTIVTTGNGWYLAQDAAGARTGAVSDIKTLWGRSGNETLIDGGNIYTNSIKATSIALADFNNYAGDGSFLYNNSWGYNSGAVRTADGTNPNYVTLTKDVTGNKDLYSLQEFDLQPTDQFYIEGEIYRPSTNASTATAAGEVPRVGLNSITPANGNNWQTANTIVDASGNEQPLTAANVDALATDTWRKVRGFVTILAGYTKGRVWITVNGTTISNNQYRFRNIRVFRRNGGELIVDGSIQANKITAGTYTGGEFIIGSGGILKTSNSEVTITSNGITVTGANSSVTANAIQAGTISASGDIVVNSNIRSSNFGASAGFQLNSTGLIIRQGEVAATTLRTGTITSTTLGGALTLGGAASLILDGGHIKSNTYTGTTYNASATAGFYLGNDGLRIAQGAVSAATLTTGDISSASITLSSTGEVKTTGYNGTAGFRLSSSGLEIPTGSLDASKINTISTINMMPALWAVGDINLPTSVNSAVLAWNNTNYTISSNRSINVSFSGTAGTARGFSFIPTTDIPIPVTAGKTYFLSFYARNNTTTAVAGTFGYVTQTGTFQSTGITTNQGSIPSSASGWTRMWATLVVPAGVTGIRPYFTSTVAAFDYSANGMQVEEKLTATAPRDWKMPGGTYIEGGLIRTGIIASSVLRESINSQPSTPMWSVNLEGKAEFADLLVRGQTIVGSPQEDAEGLTVGAAGSRIQSHNYTDGGSVGWAIHSNGLAEFRSLVVGTFPQGYSLENGSIIAEDVKVTGSGAIRASGDMGEDVSIDANGFHVLGAYQVSIDQRALASNGTATLRATQDHGFSVGKRLVVTGVGALYDGDNLVVDSVPSPTTFTYTIAGTPGATETTTTFTGGIAKSMSTGVNLERPPLIEFPTNGANPNIISGTLTSDTLLVTKGATFRGISHVERDADFLIESNITAPNSAPMVSANYNDMTLSAAVSGNPLGITKGHDGGLYIISNDSNRMYITRYSMATGTPVKVGIVWQDTRVSQFNQYATRFTDTIYGITYSPVHNKYYVSMRRETMQPIDPSYGPGQVVTYTRNENIETLDPATFDTVDYLTLFSATWTQGQNPPTWKGTTIGFDYVANVPFVAMQTGTAAGVRLYRTTVNATTGIPSYAGSADLASTTLIDNPGFVTRLNNFSSATSGDKYYLKAHDYGTSGWTQQFLPYTTGGAYDAPNTWRAAYGSYVSGAYYDWTHGSITGTGRIYHLSNTKLYEYQDGDSTWTGSNVTANRYVGYSWYDSNSLNTNTHETDMSPIRVFSFPKKARLTVTIPEVPIGQGTSNDPNSARIYVAEGTTQPSYGDTVGTVSSAWHLRTTIYYPDNTVAINPETAPAGAPPRPKGDNQFAQALGANPGVIRSAAVDINTGQSLIELNGDGSGRVGPWHFGTNGRLPAAHLGKSTSQVLTADVTTQVLMNTERFISTGGMTMQSGGLVVPISGWYQVNGNITFAASTSGERRFLWIAKGATPGTMSAYFGVEVMASTQATAHITSMATSAVIYCNAGEWIALAALAGTGWALDVSQVYMTGLSAAYLGT